MSDFSDKCREYLKDTGENVYQLSASSGLDRTSLQRMITGKRLPGIDFVRQFCDSLRINPSQRRELMELYKIEKIGKYTFSIILTQGLNRQIRRMCEALGYKVTTLKRIRIMNVELGNLKPGEVRGLTEQELKELYGTVKERENERTGQPSE